MLARIVVVVLLLCVVTDARAEAPLRVVLVGADSTLRDAVNTALSPWGIELRVVNGRTIPNSGVASRIAHDASAVAVIWVRSSGTSADLRMYDRVSGRVASVPLHAPPPYDAPTAAAVALNIKTLLRHSNAAPVAERLRVVVPARRARQLYLELVGVAVFPRTGVTKMVPGVGAAVVWLPTFARSRLRLVAAYEYRGRTRIATAELDGTFTDQAVRLAAGGRSPVGGRVTLGADVGVSLRASRLEGTAPGRLETIGDDRFNPTVDVAAHARLGLIGSLGLVVRGRGSLLLRRQSYFLGQQSVFALPRADFGVEVAVSVPLY